MCEKLTVFECPECGSMDLDLEITIFDNTPYIMCQDCDFYMSGLSPKTLVKYWNQLSRLNRNNNDKKEPTNE